MFEMPGLNGTGDPKKDLDKVRRWLARFVPELEQQLQELGADQFSSAYNERAEGITALTGATNQQSTAGALAEHLLDTNNPHQVTLSQLGASKYKQTEHGWAIVICGIMIQCRRVALEAGTAEALGSIYYRDADMGDWDIPFKSVMMAWASVNQNPSGLGDSWAGARTVVSATSAGRVRVYSPTADGEAVTVNMYCIGREDINA